MTSWLIWIFMVVIFLAGLYTVLTYSTNQFREGFGGDHREKRCPDLLIRDGEQLILKNTKLADIPGVNPVRFKNLEEYSDFVKWQRSHGINCPVLYYTKTYDAQSHEGYMPSDLPPISQVDVNDVNEYADEPPLGSLTYPAMDTHNQEIGANTELNKYFYVGEGDLVSANAADTNWGGSEFTNVAIKQGHYKGNEVYKTPAKPMVDISATQASAL